MLPAGGDVRPDRQVNISLPQIHAIGISPAIIDRCGERPVWGQPGCCRIMHLNPPDGLLSSQSCFLQCSLLGLCCFLAAYLVPPASCHCHLEGGQDLTYLTLIRRSQTATRLNPDPLYETAIARQSTLLRTLLPLCQPGSWQNPPSLPASQTGHACGLGVINNRYRRCAVSNSTSSYSRVQTRIGVHSNFSYPLQF